MKRQVIAIDGPAASGKSTAARGVARVLGFVHVNSGLFYRAITWALLERGWDAADPGFGARLRELELHTERPAGVDGPSIGLKVRVGGRDPGVALTGETVTACVSEVASHPEVRDVVLGHLRDLGHRYDLVCDGRDIGTAVFPDAALKVFLVADAEVRARRRLLERGESPGRSAVMREAARLEQRDRVDASREHAPLRRADDAVALDTGSLTAVEVVARIVELAGTAGIARRDVQM